MQQKPKGVSISDGEGRTPLAHHVRVVTRLSPDIYRRFEQSLPKAVIDKNAGDAGTDAAYKLGIQYILAKLRDDLVTE